MTHPLRSVAPLCLLLGFILLTGCTCPSLSLTQSSGQQWQESRLYFGLSLADGAVSSEQFDEFVDREITPLFPAGLTVLHATGQWQTDTAEIIKESSRVVVILHPPSVQTDDHLRQISRRYAAEFDQDSVLFTRAYPVQVEFVGPEQ